MKISPLSGEFLQADKRTNGRSDRHT